MMTMYLMWTLRMNSKANRCSTCFSERRIKTKVKMAPIKKLPKVTIRNKSDKR